MKLILLGILLILIVILLLCIKFKNIQHFENKKEYLKLECVLTACNENPLYMEFIPIFVKIWNKLYPLVDVKIILIANKIPDKFKKYKDNIILYKPLPNISTAFTSQYIRLLYPALLNHDNGIMITDIDDVPLNRTYFKNNIESVKKDKWLNLRDWSGKNGKQIAMCWQIATRKIWREVFNINSINDVNNKLIEIYKSIKYDNKHGGSGWNTDQVMLYKSVMDWNKKTNNYVYLKDSETGFNRLDREEENYIKLNQNMINNIKNGKYSDFHLVRPYSKFKYIIEKIYGLL